MSAGDKTEKRNHLQEEDKMPHTRSDNYKLLIIDDDKEILTFLKDGFTAEGYVVYAASNLREARNCLARQEVHVVLSDQNLPDGKGIDFLVELSGIGVDVIPILMTGYADLDTALEAINRGKVYKFVKKPLDLISLKQTIQRAAEHHALLIEKKHLAMEVLRHNQLLRHQSEIQQQSLESAQTKIRKHSKKMRWQKKQIETLYTEIQSAYLRTVTSLCAAIEAKDRYTRGHSDRVYYYCNLIGRRLGLKKESFEALKLASILHDVGKIGIPDTILGKESPLTEPEMHIIQEHPKLAETILAPLPFLDRTSQIILHHHERHDGKGYPDSLKGDDIPIEARILAVADAYDAMRSHRPYRKALSKRKALAQLKAGSGKQFCPLCVSALSLSLEQEGEDFQEENHPLTDSLFLSPSPPPSKKDRKSLNAN